MSLTIWIGTCIATMFRRQPGAEVEEEAVAVAQLDHDAGAGLGACGGNGQLPTNEMRISSGASFSADG